MRSSTTIARSVDERIAAGIASGRGIATVDDLEDLDIDRRSVRRRLKSGELIEVFRDVVAYPQDALYPSTRRRAAVLSCGDGAVLGGWSAAEQWRLITFQTRADTRPQVLVPYPRDPRRAGIDIVRTGTLGAEDVLILHGTPCLRIPRLLRSLAATRGARFVQRLADEAFYLGVWDADEIEAFLARSASAAGAPALRAALAGHALGTTRTANDVEEAFLAISDARGWPRPLCQAQDHLPDGQQIFHDFLWPDLGVAGETDGGRGHAGEHRRSRDAARDAGLAAKGIEVVRARWDEVLFTPDVVGGRFDPVLRRHGWSSPVVHPVRAFDL